MKRKWIWVLACGVPPTCAVAPKRAEAGLSEAKWGDFPKVYGASLIAGAVLSTPFFLREADAPAASEMGFFSIGMFKTPIHENAFGGSFETGTYFTPASRLGFRVRSSLMTVISPEDRNDLTYKIDASWNFLLAMRRRGREAAPFRVAAVLPGPAIIYNGLGTYFGVPSGALAAYRLSDAFGVQFEALYTPLINSEGAGGMLSGRIELIWNLVGVLNLSAGYYVGSVAAPYRVIDGDGKTKFVNGRWPLEQTFTIGLGFGG